MEIKTFHLLKQNIFRNLLEFTKIQTPQIEAKITTQDYQNMMKSPPAKLVEKNQNFIAT